MYTTRFAPAPTGPLHLGSLFTAVASYLQARCQGGRWLVRMEDLDTPRVQKGAGELILTTLQAFGMNWDGDVLYQSQRSAAYAQALDSLQAQGLVYPCNCPRDKTKNRVYKGDCRNGMIGTPIRFAMRIRSDTSPVEISFNDLIHGKLKQNINTEVGDFILKRSDGLFAYQLAVVVDDAWQDVTHIVRGADLLNNTPRQLYLQRLLGLPPPTYAHVPLLTDTNGYKLSKQNHAPALDTLHPVPQLWQVLEKLGQAPPRPLAHGSLVDLWEWSFAHWDMGKVPLRHVLLES